LDAAGWGILITLFLGAPTLWFAIRATRVSEQALALEERREREAKRATLEMADPDRRGRIWQFMGFWPGHDDRSHAYFESMARNRGPAVAYDMDWSAFAGSEKIELSGGLPTFLYPLHDGQLVVKIPLVAELSPTVEPIRIHVEWTDDENRKTGDWCFQFAGEGDQDPHAWTATEVDCISLRPKRWRPQ
jgi:hypothetical protein